MKEFLSFENARNKQHARTYELLMKIAFGKDTAVFVGHHLSFMFGGDLATENEIPSCDSLMFDHDVMQKVFGRDAVAFMQQLAALPCGQRDLALANMLDNLVVTA